MTQSHGLPSVINSYAANTHSWIDPSALGGLAYAATLGQNSRNHTSPTREGSSPQQTVNYNRSRPSISYADTSVYGMTGSLADDYGDHQPDRGGGAATRDGSRSTESPNSRSTPYTMYASDGNHQAQPYASSRGKSRTAKMIQRPDSASQASTPTLSGVTGKNVRVSELSQRQPQDHLGSKPQDKHQWSNTDLRASPNFIPPTSKSVKKTPNPKAQQTLQANAISVESSSANVQEQKSLTPSQQHGNQSPLKTQPPTLDIRANGDDPENWTQAENQYPTTVNPNEIFDDAGYQNSRAAAAAAAKAEAARKEAENAAAKKAEAEASVNDTAGDSTTKTQMELEMKQMLEKMRDYQTKDPNLFSQIWEQVKKVQPPNRKSSTKDAPNKESNSSKSTTEVNENDLLLSPYPANNQLSLEPELPIGPFQQDEPDLGRDRAQRRKRKGAKSAGGKSIHRGQTLDSGNATPMSTSAVHPTSSGPVNKATRNDSLNAALQGQSMRAAMESFDESLKSNRKANRRDDVGPEVIYVKGAGPALPAFAEASPSPEPGSTIWPQEIKLTLASASAIALKSNSMNAGKNISVTEIVHILDQNPSYADLCNILERKGFNIDRAHFARSLLATVPSLDKSSLETQGSSPVNISNSNHLPHNEAANGTVKSAVNGAVNGSNNGAVNGRVNGAVRKISVRNESAPQSHGKDGVVDGYENGITYSTHGKPPKKRRRKSNNLTTNGIGSGDQSSMLVPSDQVEPTIGSADPSGSRDSRWTPPEAPMTESGSKRFSDLSRLKQSQVPAASTPLTKKEMARKRSFSELIDLTQDLSDEEDEVPVPKAHVAHNSKDEVAKPSTVSGSGAVSDGVRATSIRPTSKKEKRKRRELLGSADRSGLNSSVATEDESLDLSRFKYADSHQDLLQSAIIIRPIDKKNDALRRSTYDPRTIATDILVSAGKHPTMAPLNHHLNILRKRFTHVGHHSNLATFRWDLVDPGGQEVNSTVLQDVNMDDANGEGLSIEKDATSARHGLPVSMTVDGKGRVATAGTINTQPVKDKSHRRKSGVSRGDETSVRGGPSNGVFPLDPHRRVITTVNETPSPGEPQESTQPSSRPPGASPGEPHRRRSGRSKYSPPSGTSGSNQVKTPLRPRPSDVVPLRSRSSDTVPLRSRSSDAVPLRSRPSDAVPLRPSGLRNVLPNDGVVVVIESRSSDIGLEKKRKSAAKEPSRRKQEKLSIHPSTPSYKVYKCLWKNCPYELHNLDNLRKHVRKHREEFGDGPFPCLWADCGRSTVLIDLGDENEVLKPHEFGSHMTWERHIDKKHVDEYAWEFGDGPSAHPSDAEASDFLGDSQGRRVTPRISANSSAPPDPLPLSSSRRTARIYHKAHGNRTEAEKAKAVLDSLVAKKRATGLGITKGGSPFMTEKMRASMRSRE